MNVFKVAQKYSKRDQESRIEFYRKLFDLGKTGFDVENLMAAVVKSEKFTAEIIESYEEWQVE